eukprot:s11_g70.t1
MAQAYPPKLVQAMIQGLKDDEKSRQQSMVTYTVFTVEKLETEDEKKIVRILKRCHENLGHPSNQRFVAMLKAARANETCLRLAKGLTCSTCKDMMGEKSHNVSKTLKDLEFNDMISVDTFELELEWRKVKLLNVVDLATRFQVVVPLWKGIEIKKVRKAYRRSWKRWAGVPRILISDGGPEFGAEWTDMLAGDGTEHSVTAAYAPWQNGTCERAGGTFKTAFMKAALEIEPKTKEEVEELCDQLCVAHNMMTRKDGYSPCQHVFGVEARFPGSLLLGEHVETVESAELHNERRHVRAQRIRQEARKAFLDADAEDRVKRASQHRSRPNRGPFQIGDQVVIWRKANNERKHHWHGPGRVIGAQVDKVWVAYGSKVYRCAPEQVRHVEEEIKDLAEWLPLNLRNLRSTLRQKGAGNIVELDHGEKPPLHERQHVVHEEHDDAVDRVHVHDGEDMSVDGRDDMDVENPNRHDENSPGGLMNQGNNIPESADSQEETAFQSGESDQDMEHGHDMSRQNTLGENMQDMSQQSLGDAHRDQASPGSSIGYGPVRTTSLTHALRNSVNMLDFGRPRGSTQPQPHVETSAEEVLCAETCHENRSHFEEVYVAAVKKQGRKEVTPKSLNPEKREELERARVKEWNKMVESGAVVVHNGENAKKILDQIGQDRTLESRFVYTSEDGSPNTKLKARWCIRGYLDPDVCKVETASPTLSSEGLAITLQVLSSYGWRLRIADVETAFLRGENLQRPTGRILAKPPKDGIPGVNEGELVELIKPVYGLVDAPRLWWESLSKTLVGLGMKASELDGCMFYKHDASGNLAGIIAFHVDDLVFGGNDQFLRDGFEPLKAKYPFKHVKEGSGEFLGKKLTQKEDKSIVVQQKEYAGQIECLHVTKERRKDKEADTTDQEKGQMRAVLGELNWLVTGSRPDLAASCSLLQQRVVKSKVKDLLELNRVVSMARDHAAVEIHIKPIAPKELEICAWSDASFANAEDWKSQGGYMICATTRDLRLDNWAPISPWRWRSFKQERQVASTLGAELLTLSRTIAEAKWMRSLWCEANFAGYDIKEDQVWTSRIPVTLAIDSKPAFDHIRGQTMTIKDKRLAIEMLLVKRDVKKEGVEVKWLPTEHMLVDGLTKMGAPMELLRKAMSEGKMILVESPLIMQWIGKKKTK